MKIGKIDNQQEKDPSKNCFFYSNLANSILVYCWFSGKKSANNYAS